MRGSERKQSPAFSYVSLSLSVARRRQRRPPRIQYSSEDLLWSSLAV